LFNTEEKTNYTPGDIFQINYNGTMVTFNLINSNSVIWTTSIDYSRRVHDWIRLNSRLEMYNNTETTVTLSGIMFDKKVATQPINMDCVFGWGECDTTTGTQDMYVTTPPLNQGQACPEQLTRNCP